jgi:anti-sigma factor RsiW
MSEHQHGSGRCLELAERLSEFVDGELPEPLRIEIEQHNDECTKCQKFVESLQRVRDLAHLVSPPELPDERLRQISAAARRRLES